MLSMKDAEHCADDIRPAALLQHAREARPKLTIPFVLRPSHDRTIGMATEGSCDDVGTGRSLGHERDHPSAPLSGCSVVANSIVRDLASGRRMQSPAIWRREGECSRQRRRAFRANEVSAGRQRDVPGAAKAEPVSCVSGLLAGVDRRERSERLLEPGRGVEAQLFAAVTCCGQSVRLGVCLRAGRARRSRLSR